MTRIINAYTIDPHDIQEGDIMMFVVKAMALYRDSSGKLRYRLYRCPYDGPEVQGSQIDSTETVCEAIFPSLALVGTPG